MPDDCEPTPNPAEVESAHWLTDVELLALSELLESNRAFFAALERGEFSLEDS